MTGWNLPVSICIGGREYHIHADFRDILEIIGYLNLPEEDDVTRRYVALSLFYDGFEGMPEQDYLEAFQQMADFISQGEPEDSRRYPKMIDWEQDRNMIAAEVNKVAGTEVRSLRFLHWWTFLGYFFCVGDGQLALIVSIREKLRKGKPLEKHEREFYNQNRTKVDFKQKFTAEEDELFDQWMGK